MIWLLFIPLVGTAAGSAMVFLLKDQINSKVKKVLLGFASGVMVAASIWSLLIPSLDMSTDMGKWSFLPAVIGFLLGMGFLLVLDVGVPHKHHTETEGPEAKKMSDTAKMLFAVTIHNIPEGMTVGVIFAGALSGNTTITMMSAFVLALGIAIQNFPEGAIVSMPLVAEGNSKGKSFLLGTLSGVVEPIAALLTILLTNIVTPILPYFLSFAAGAMFYVVIEELIPESQTGKHSNFAIISFALGFALMMILDITLG